MSQACRHTAIQTQIGHCWQLRLQQIMLHHVQHALQLAEDQHTVLSHYSLCTDIRGAG